MAVLEYPTLNLNILTEIVHDGVDLCPHVIAVGVVGSFATNQQKHTSCEVGL